MKCDELKRYEVVPDYESGVIAREMVNEEAKRKYGEFMLSEEVDAAIAELKAENESLKDALGGTNIAYNQCFDEYEQCDKELRHHKYKRCLNNAEICCEKKENCYNRALRKYSKDEADYLARKSEFWQDWEFRWLKLADKFKETK